MFEKLELTRMAQAMAANAGARLGVIARNVANADTPGFRAMEIPSFSEIYGEGAALPMKATLPGHQGLAGAEPVARKVPGAGSPSGNTVSLEEEMVKAASVRQDHEMALAIYRSTSDILRASLGRAR
jgi:flagellar basal-body rod protein FlgB